MNDFSTFKTSNHALFDFVSAFPEPAHIKDSVSRKYIFSNKHNLTVYGINNPEKIVGLTVHDLDNFMNPYWGEGFANQIGDFDTIVIKRQSTLTDENRIFLDKYGLLHIQNMTKVPILNSENKVSAILTTSFDITKRINRFVIFNKYKNLYRKKRQACDYLMKHMNINMFFNEVLSEKEIICLLHMTENSSHKYVAKKMNVSTKTIESHVNNIINKLKLKTVSELLEFLRKPNNGNKI